MDGCCREWGLPNLASGLVEDWVEAMVEAAASEAMAGEADLAEYAGFSAWGCQRSALPLFVL